MCFPQWDSSSSRKAKHFYRLFMDVVGENEALQQFFEGESLVLGESLNTSPKENWEVAEDSLPFITYEIMVIFMMLESSLPAPLYHVRLKRFFCPLIILLPKWPDSNCGNCARS